MNDMASIRKIRPLPAAVTRCALGGEVPGEPVDATTAFDVVCFLGGVPHVYQAVKLTFMPSAHGRRTVEVTLKGHKKRAALKDCLPSGPRVGEYSLQL